MEVHGEGLICGGGDSVGDPGQPYAISLPCCYLSCFALPCFDVVPLKLKVYCLFVFCFFVCFFFVFSLSSY